MSYNIRVLGHAAEGGQGQLPATAQTAHVAAQHGHPERRDWRKRRKLRARRAGDLRGT